MKVKKGAEVEIFGKYLVKLEVGACAEVEIAIGPLMAGACGGRGWDACSMKFDSFHNLYTHHHRHLPLIATHYHGFQPVRDLGPRKDRHHGRKCVQHVSVCIRVQDNSNVRYSPESV